MLMQENVPLAQLTTLQVGGPARYLVEARSFDDVRSAVAEAASRSLPLFVLGGGSNLVIADSGWPGVVLKMAIGGIEEREESGKTMLEAGAGEEWDALVELAVSRNCGGIECLSGIPGTVGGTPVQNVGAYGQEVSDTIESVLVFDRRDAQIRELCNQACGFVYRTSIFNTTERDRFIVLRVTFALTAAASPQIRYADLQHYFAGSGTLPTLAEVRRAVREIRMRKAMLIVPGDEDSRSAGSFFKNPVLTAEEHDALTARAAGRNMTIPSYPALDAHHKVSAAWLVEHSGFQKGDSAGRVGISRKHALAIVNRGGASAEDVISFQERIQKAVEETWGIRLQPEPVMIGF